jgi:hypothetical protein
MDDYVTPHYHKRSQRGEVFFNPMKRTVVRSLSENGTERHVRRKVDTIACGSPPTNHRWEHRTVGSSTTAYCLLAFGHNHDALAINSPLPIGSVFSGEELAAMQSEASTRVLAQRGTADSNLFESIAQMDQTASMLTGPLSFMDDYLKKKSTKALAAGAASGWLIYRYGLLPAIRDITQILESRHAPVGKRRKTSRATISERKVAIDIKPTVDYGGWTSNIMRKTEDVVEIRAMSLDEYYADSLTNAGFTAKGLMGLPWELIPFSFVADWFVNVGDFLYAHMPSFGYKQLGSCLVTTRDRQTTYSMLDHYELPGSIWDIVTPPTGSVSGSVWERTRSSLSEPRLAVKTSFRLDNSTRITDAISLLTVVGSRMNLLFGSTGKRSRR